MDDKSISLCGRVADTLLGERLNGIQEVSGSIPLISTKTWNLRISGLFLYFRSRFFFGQSKNAGSRVALCVLNQYSYSFDNL